MAKKKRTLFSVFTTVELTIVCIVFAAIMVPLLFGIKPSVVLTGSMEPTVPTGAVAWCNSNFTEDDLTDDTIAVYEPEQGTEVMHRIIAVNGDGTYTFKGDNNNTEDLGHPTGAQINSLYMFHIPLIGQWLTWVVDNKVVVIIVFLILNIGIYTISTMITWLNRKQNTETEDFDEDEDDFEEEDENYSITNYA